MPELCLDNLRPVASLNRRRFLVPPALAGKTAYDVLSTRALVAAIAARALDLGLSASDADAASPQALNAALGSPDGAVRRAAKAIAAGYGQRLGYLLASMTGGNSVSDDPWEQQYLCHWEHEVDTVVLGGGLASGALGQVIARSAQASAQQLGRSIAVEAAQHPSLLPLIGVARCHTPGRSLTATSASANPGKPRSPGLCSPPWTSAAAV